MKKFLGMALAISCSAGAATVFAAGGQVLPVGAASPFATDSTQWQATPLSHEKVAGTNERGGTPQANPLRAYPPSCASGGTLPDKPSGAAVSIDLKLLAVKASGYVIEPVKIIVWRIPCSSSGIATRYNPSGGAAGMTLLRVERSAELADQFYYVPLVSVAQGTIEFGKPASYPRLVSEPNTSKVEVLAGTTFNTSMTFVLENSPVANSGYFLFNNAFKLRVDSRPQLGQNGQVVDTDIAAYAAPSAPAPMTLDGYAAAQWTNATLGQGLIVQVTEQYNPDGAMVRQLVYDLLLKDLAGNPFWLVGSAFFPIGATSVTIPASYLDKDLAAQRWGTATFQVKDCNNLEVTYAPDANLPATVPTFSGPTTYNRLFSANGMLCE